MNEKMNGGISTMRGIFCRLSFQKGGITAETIAAQGFDGGIFSVDTRQVMIIRTTLSKLVMCSDLSFLLKMYYSKQRQGQFLSLPLLIFFAMMIKMGTL